MGQSSSRKRWMEASTLKQALCVVEITLRYDGGNFWRATDPH